MLVRNLMIFRIQYFLQPTGLLCMAMFRSGLLIIKIVLYAD